MKTQLYRGLPHLQEVAAWIHSWHMPPDPHKSLGAWKVATTDEYTYILLGI